MGNPSARTSVRVLAVASAAALALGGLAQAAVAAPAPQHLGNASDYRQLPAGSPAKVTPNRWMVQVAGQPSAKGGSDKANKQQQDSVVQSAKAAGIAINVKNNHTQLWNGMAVEVSDTSVSALRSIPGVVAVYPAVQVQAPKPISHTLEPNIANAIAMTGVAQANASGWTGKGIKVGVIDSGIDLDHPDLGGNGVPGQAPFPNARVKWGYDFVGDNYDAGGRYGSTTPTPDPIPDDCGGHGSHVAGIIGANGGGRANSVTGIAPDVEFGAYRIFGCEGSVDTDVIVSAIERATADGMDIINMSLGWGFYTWPDAPEAQAADAAVDKGVIVVDAMGNDGEYGTFTGGAPAVGRKQIAVASIENTTITTPSFLLNGKPIGYSAAGALAPKSGTMPIVSAGPDVAPTAMTGTEPVTGCDAAGPYTVDPKGKALLVKRGVCTFYEKAIKAQKAGATALVIYNREDALMGVSLAGPEEITIPVLFVKLSDGLALQADIAAKGGQSTIEFSAQTVQNPNPQAGLASSFTSIGLAADLDLKPDVAAPGGNIWSTYPLEKGGYTNMSGTSMATPHTVGSIALLLQARPEYKKQALKVRELLQNYSNPTLWHFAPQYGLLEMTAVQGSGLINVYDAILSKAFASPGKLSLLEGRGAKTSTITLTNNSAAAKTYAITHEDTVGASAPTHDPSFDLFPSTVTHAASVTVPAGGQAQVPVTIQPSADAPNGYLYGGYVVFTNGDEKISIPFGGMAGDYQAEKVLTDAPDGTPLPALGFNDPDGKTVPVTPDTKLVFTAKKNPVSVMFHLAYPASNVIIDVYAAKADGTKGAYVGQVVETGKVGRDDSMQWFTWDGSYLAKPGKKKEFKKAGPGSYILELRVLKPLGDPADPAMWEIWDSPAFSIKSMN